MTGGKGQKVELQSIRVIHLPNGQIEMAYGGNQVATQTTRHGGGDYFPATAKFREGYTFARQAPRAYPRSYASGPAQRLEAEEEEREAAAAQLQQEQLQQQSAQAEQEIGEENSISPESYEQMIHKLTAIHHQQALAQFKQKHLMNSLSPNAGAEILSNQVMRAEAGQLEKSFAPPRRLEQPGFATLRRREAARRSLAVKKAKLQQLDQVGLPAAPVFPQYSAPPTPMPAVNSDVQGSSAEVEINAMQARLQADEVAIATLTKDVQELRAQNAELEAHQREQDEPYAYKKAAPTMLAAARAPARGRK